VVVGDLDVEGPGFRVRQLKTHPPLLVDADAELAFSVPAQRFEAVAREVHQIVLAGRVLEDLQTPLCLLLESLEFPDPFSSRKALRASVSLRAERAGGGSGRVYTITVVATDRAGNTSLCVVKVSVPKSLGK